MAPAEEVAGTNHCYMKIGSNGLRRWQGVKSRPNVLPTPTALYDDACFSFFIRKPYGHNVNIVVVTDGGQPTASSICSALLLLWFSAKQGGITKFFIRIRR